MTTPPEAHAPFDYSGHDGWERDAHRVSFPKPPEPYTPPLALATTSELMHAVLNALPAADPVGALVAALHRHDQLMQRLLADLARRDGLTRAQILARYGLLTEEGA